MAEKLIKNLANNQATVNEPRAKTDHSFNGFICEILCEQPQSYRIKSAQGNSPLVQKFLKEKLQGRAIDEVCGKRVSGQVRPYLERALSGEQSEAEINLYQRTYLCIFSRLIGSGKPVGATSHLQCVAIDITAQQDSIKAARRANKYITGIFKALNSSTIVSIADRKGNIIMANDMFCKISGYSQNELLGENHRIVNSGFHNKSFWRDMWHTITNGNTWRAEVCNRKKTGELYWVDTVVHPLFSLDEPGVISQFLSLRTVITGRKQLEQELSRKNTLLHQMGIMSRTGGGK